MFGQVHVFAAERRAWLAGRRSGCGDGGGGWGAGGGAWDAGCGCSSVEDHSWFLRNAFERDACLLFLRVDVYLRVDLLDRNGYLFDSHFDGQLCRNLCIRIDLLFARHGVLDLVGRLIARLTLSIRP